MKPSSMRPISIKGSSPLGFHRMAVAEWGVRGKGDVPVICVHGLARNGRDFDYLASALQKDRHVLCPDIVGRGRSDFLADPTLYNYGQYVADLTALIAYTGAAQVDWVGTSMGGILGMMVAAMPNNPIRRLVVNDVGPVIPLAALKRIADYVGFVVEFADAAQAERHLRKIYEPFGITDDAVWRHYVEYGLRTLPNGKLALGHDPAIAVNFRNLDKDVDFWPVYDRINCPVLLYRGATSDVLSVEVAEEMSRRGPKAELITWPDAGHAPALIDGRQIEKIMQFLA